MADYLTFENNANLTIKVNGNTVSSGYELKDGDVITATVPGSPNCAIVINNTDTHVTDTNTTINIYDESIYISYLYSGGAVN